jgi:hypothetical protein
MEKDTLKDLREKLSSTIAHEERQLKRIDENPAQIEFIKLLLMFLIGAMLGLTIFIFKC